VLQKHTYGGKRTILCAQAVELIQELMENHLAKDALSVAENVWKN
jgi:hypothetical protein